MANYEWVDPRSDPKPPGTGLPPRITDEPDDIIELIELCKTGRIYAVERWIRSGKPLQVRMDAVGRWQHPTTPLVVAIKTGQHDLALLLLCNGYNTEVEPPSTLDLVLEQRAWDFMELLLAWGADPKRVSPYEVLDTYRSEIMERFSRYGVDFCEDNCLASHLASATRNKPAYGWAKRHQSEPKVAYQLALALGDAVFENSEKAVSLLMWAGADPHRKVPSLRWGSGQEDDPHDDRDSAIEVAVDLGRGRLLRHLKPDPEVDNFDELYAWVCDPETLDCLFDLRPPKDWSKAIVRNAMRMSWWHGDWRESRRCLERIFEHHWGRLNSLDHDRYRDLRRDLVRMESDSDFSWLLETLANPRHCDEAIFAELTRTPSMRKRMKRLELIGLLPQRGSRSRKERSRSQNDGSSQWSWQDQEDQWLSSLDADAKAEVLRHRITREQLYQEVWAEPATKVAQRYRVSDVAIAKWCQKLSVPRPGRGYWARKNAGYRVSQAPLPKAKRGQKKYVNRPSPRERPSAPTSTKPPGLELFEKPIPVPAGPGQEHRLIVETRRALKVAEKDEQGVLCPQGPKTLNVWVSESSVDRALRVMNALIGALEGAGFKVVVTDILDSKGHVAGHTTSAVIHDERIAFSISEKMERMERPPNREERAVMRRSPWKKGPFFDYLPTGLLSLQIESGRYRERHRRTWSDGKNRRLEDCLFFFVRSLLISAEARSRLRKAHE